MKFLVIYDSGHRKLIQRLNSTLVFTCVEVGRGFCVQPSAIIV